MTVEIMQILANSNLLKPLYWILFTISTTITAEEILLSPFSGSEIVDQSASRNTFYILHLSPLKMINGELQSEKNIQLSGQVSRTTYQIPNSIQKELVFTFFNDQISKKNGTLLFSCQGRACGSSNDWANQIFKNKTLYGRDRYQRYTVYKISVNNSDTFILLYLTRRGNGRQYIHIEQISSNIQTNNKALLTVEQLNTLMIEQKRIIIPDLQFDNYNRINNTSNEAVNIVTKLVELNGDKRFWLVGHLSDRNRSVDELIEVSQQRAAAVKQALINRGVSANRLTVYGAGPLTPVDSQKINKGYIELVIDSTL